MHGKILKEELLERISRYETLTNDLALILACITYWARPIHKTILQKTLARSTDRIESPRDFDNWSNLRWYPLILELYCSGIAAIEGGKYDSLASIFDTKISPSDYRERSDSIVEIVSNGILELTRANVFKQLPGHEKHYTPMSEYLYKILQPKLDDILFIGKNYEKSFDEFEVLFALVVADSRIQRGEHLWAPIGRFGWKGQRTGRSSPLTHIINEAQSLGNNWEPFKAGLFGGNLKRFNEASSEFKQIVSGLGWW